MATIDETKPMIAPDHLGDGVYVEFDGYHIVLRANHHQDPNPIYLDPSVLEALNRYVQRIKDEI